MNEYEGHTPGPWHYDAIDDQNQWVLDDAGRYLAELVVKDSEARCVSPTDAEANGRLMADAPMLLAQRDALAAALRWIEAKADNAKDNPRATDALFDIRDEARAALAKLEVEP